MQTAQYQIKDKDLNLARFDSLKEFEPQIGFVFGSTKAFENQSLFKKLFEEFPHTVWLGCSTAGEISTRGVFDNTLVISTIRFDRVEAKFKVVYKELKDMTQSYFTGTDIGKSLKGEELSAAIVLGPGVNINGSALVQGIVEQIGADVLLTGGLAADGGKFEKTYILTPNGVSHSQVVALGFYGDSVGFRHGCMGGWQPFGKVRTVTKSNANIIFEIDGEPALAVYEKYLGNHAADLPASGLMFPLALLNDDKDESGLIRTLLGIDRNSGSLIFAGDIPQGSLIKLMHTNTQGLVSGASEAAKHAVFNESNDTSLALVVSCIGRKIVMGVNVDEEIDAISRIFGGGCLVTGFYSNGEISPFEETVGCHLHNQTMTISYLFENIKQSTQNKTLKRIVKKYTGIQSYEELTSTLTKLSDLVTSHPELTEKNRDFLLNLGDVFSGLDQALAEFERLVEIKERSLTTSSKELTELNLKITEQSEKQYQALKTLTETVRVLSPIEYNTGKLKSIHNDSHSDAELTELINLVGDLVKKQQNYLGQLKEIYKESQNILNFLQLAPLKNAITESAKNLLNTNFEPSLYFSGALFDDQLDNNNFYLISDTGSPIHDSVIIFKPDQLYIYINSTRSGSTLAILEIVYTNKPDEIIFEEHQDKLRALVPAISAAIENSNFLKDERQKQRMENELETARLVQKTLLPISSDISKESIHVNGFYQSASECGGDFWQYLESANGNQYILVGDVTGHGTGSAMTVAVIRGYCDSFKNQTNISPSLMLSELNTLIYNLYQGTGYEMTMVILEISNSTDEIKFSSAGHPHPILLSPDNSNLNYLSSIGPSLGSTKEATYKDSTFSFKHNEKIIVYTDGLTECMNIGEEQFGDAKLRRSIQNNPELLTSNSIVQFLVEEFNKHRLGAELKDDITIVSIHRVEPIGSSFAFDEIKPQIPKKSGTQG
jgi:serine phosphatase RsbU (regulator of sigma subunit)